ncbi:hypothetical protein AB833_03235 [Chromatiales bacterium (ex Bugula neritina AB1)]|nr:hypothetical protein AB833_03235 [Chromatiales bacterium (ex Bugula neritina AB1)]
MRLRCFTLWGTALLLALSTFTAQAKEVVPMLGGVIIDGYEFGADIGPKGSVTFDESTGEFIGAYNGLKMPAGRRAIFAWVHDTVNQKSEYIGPVGWLKTGTAGKDKGRFRVAVPEKFKSGDFGSNEILGFTSEKTAFINGKGEAVTTPTEPSGSDIQKELKPAFYLYAALPGADTDLHYCGHGQDFFYAKAPEKQVCYD